jgi:DNA polymerase elongation subunit (family B)
MIETDSDKNGEDKRSEETTTQQTALQHKVCMCDPPTQIVRGCETVECQKQFTEITRQNVSHVVGMTLQGNNMFANDDTLPLLV